MPLKDNDPFEQTLEPRVITYVLGFSGCTMVFKNFPSKVNQFYPHSKILKSLKKERVGGRGGDTSIFP